MKIRVENRYKKNIAKLEKKTSLVFSRLKEIEIKNFRNCDRWRTRKGLRNWKRKGKG